MSQSPKQPPKYENVVVTSEKTVTLADPKGDKDELDYEPTERDKLRDTEEGLPLQTLKKSESFLETLDPVLTVEGIIIMTNSKRDLSKEKALRKTSIISSKAVGCSRYFGLLYTLMSTNMFSLSSNLLKKLGHVNPMTLGCYAFPMGALLSAPFIWYTLKIEKKPVMTNILPWRENKKAIFFMWFRAMVSVLISYGLIASFRYITVADSRTILAASVITVNFFGWICLGEKCGIVPIFVAIMALCGIGIMTRPPILTGAESFDSKTLIGVAIAFGCMILATVIILCLRFLQNVHHGVLNTFLYLWAFLSTLPFAIAFGYAGIPDSTWDLVGCLGVGALWALGNTFLVLALQVEEAGVVALIRTSEVIFTFCWQAIILGIMPDYISLVGAAVVVSGVIVVTLRKWVASFEKDAPMRKRLGFLLL